MIVYEARPRWARLLRPLAADRLQQVRSLRQLRQAVEANSGGLIAVELRPMDAVACLATVTELQMDYAVVAIGLVDRQLKPHAAQLSEFGMDVLVYSALDLGLVKPLLRRVAVANDAGSKVHGTLREEVWSRIPWKRYATGGSQSAAK